MKIKCYFFLFPRLTRLVKKYHQTVTASNTPCVGIYLTESKQKCFNPSCVNFVPLFMFGCSECTVI